MTEPIKIAVVGDVHTSDQSPANRTGHYRQDILDKVGFCVQEANRQQATHLLFLGDLFDKRKAHRVSHLLVNELSALIGQAEMPVLILVGNHDIDNDTLDSLPKQPITSLALDPNVTLLTWGKVNLAPDVVLWPIPGVSLDSLEQFAVHEETATRNILAVHQLIVPDMSQIPIQARRFFYDSHEVAKHVMSDLVLYGDVHSDHGLYARDGKKGKVVFMNRGSICRKSLSDSGHPPRLSFITLSDTIERKVSADFVDIPHRSAQDAFLIEQKQELKKTKQDIEKAVEVMSTASLQRSTLDDVLRDIRTNPSVEDDVRARTVELVEDVL